MTEASPGAGLQAAELLDLPLSPEDYGAGAYGELTGQPEPGDEEDQIQTDLDERAMADFIGLMYLGYLEDECTVAGHRFVLKTPTHDDRIERGELHKKHIGSTNYEPMWELLTVAAYCHSIDGVPAPEQIGPQVGPVAGRLNWVKQSIYSQIVIRMLFAECVKLDIRERAVVEYVDAQSKS